MDALDTHASPDVIGTYNDLITLAWGGERGQVLELADRDDLDEMTIVELRSLLTQFRNAIDIVSRSLAEMWMERHGESAWTDPYSGVVAIVGRASGEWKVADPDGFAEYLRGLDNEDIARIVGRVNVGTIDHAIRKAVLEQRQGSPSITISPADNPKLPKWVRTVEPGEVVHRGD